MLAGLVPPDVVDADPELQAVTARYGEFTLCRAMGWTYTQMLEQPAQFVRDCSAFLAAETDAQERRAQNAAVERRAFG